MRFDVLKTYTSLNLAITILLSISFFSILGTIILQDQSIDFYKKNYPIVNSFSIFNWRLILFLGLDHVYKSWWYLTLIGQLAFSLTSCTFIQQFPLFRRAKSCFFTKNPDSKRFLFKTSTGYSFFFKLLNNLKNKKFIIFQQSLNFYSYQGLLGRFTPIIVHLSLLIVLFGNIITGISGFQSQELIAKGEIFQVQNIINQKFFTTIPKISIRVNDFWPEYNKDYNIKQFYSNLSIIDKNGKELKQKTILVNFPLNYNSITYYQTDWDTVALRIKTNNQLNQLPLIQLQNQKNTWITWLPKELSSNNTESIILVDSFLEDFSIYDNNGNFIESSNLNNKIKNKSSSEIIEFIFRTGLEIKTDPGINITYFGFLLLILSSVLSYTTYNQIWFIKTAKQIFLGANSNRMRFDLKFLILELF